MADNPAEVVRAWFDRVWNHGDAGAIDELLSDQCSVRGLDEIDICCRDDFRSFHSKMLSIFEQVRIVIDHVIDRDEAVSGIISISAVHKPSGRPVRFRSSFFGIVRQGRIVDADNLVDYTKVLVDTGALPGDAIARGLTGERIA